MPKTAADTLAKKDPSGEVVSGGRSAVIDIWVDPTDYAPGTKAQTMYK